MKKCNQILFFFGLGLALSLSGCSDDPFLKIATECIKGGHAKSGSVMDEAQCVKRSEESFPAADDDYFKDMDYGISQKPDEVVAALQPFWSPTTPISAKEAVTRIVKGRNNWIVWTGGNDKFWDYMNAKSFGSFDLLKVLSNHPKFVGNPGYSRDNRWKWFGIVNEPCFRKNTDAQGKLTGREDRFGLYLDVRDPDCPADPFENEEKYPGVKIGARGKTVPVGSYYGYATGVVGLRLFPNPDFDEAAKKRWNAEKYYSDPDYYNDPKLIKPYRVGMSCGFCHVGPNPTNPPKDPENPQWANLNSNPGAQYFWFDRVFAYEADKTSFAYQYLHTNRPGTLDTSLISTDYINNPRTMNAVYNLPARMLHALRWGKEEVTGGERDNKQFNHFKEIHADSPLRAFFKESKDADKVLTPRVLKDGADSVGALGALNRVFVNIGLFSEEWLQHINPLVGGKPFTPFPIKTAEQNSSYWRATEQQTLDGSLFFLAATPPDYLKDAPGGERYLTEDEEILERGKKVFAENCAACHSSKLPEEAYKLFPDNGCVGPDYLKCWSQYWHWTNSSEFKEKMTKIVLEKDFLKNNFLSAELRVPVTLLETNICASIATNAIKGDTWDNFSSTSYKKLPSVGKSTIHHPVTREPKDYVMPDGGRGYIRPPSLTSIWSTAPFLLNNTVGKFYWSGSVEDRMKSFNISIEQLLWPEKRYCDQKDLYEYDEGKGAYAYGSETTNSCEGQTYLTRSGKKVPGIIDRTTKRSELKIPEGYLPWYVRIFPIGDGLELGPFPEGIPVNLVSNINMEMSLSQKISLSWNILRAVGWDISTLWKAQENPESITDEELRKILNGIVDPLLEVNKCPDFVVNKGHYFGTDYLPVEEGRATLNDSDKRALIEFLKTM